MKSIVAKMLTYKTKLQIGCHNKPNDAAKYTRRLFSNQSVDKEYGFGEHVFKMYCIDIHSSDEFLTLA